MNRSPIWNPSKLPSYWIDKIFLSPPEQDEAHQNEVDWLLEAFIQGLRTPAVSLSIFSYAPSDLHALGPQSLPKELGS